MSELPEGRPGRRGDAATERRRRDTRRFVALYLLVGGALLLPVVLHVALALRFEDALILLRYGRNLAEGRGFVFNPGERVLGVTTPLYTLVSAVLVWLAGRGAPAVQNVLGVIALLGEGLLAALLARRLAGGEGAGLWAGAIAGTLCLGSFNLSYLYFGMEVHLFAALVLLVCWLFLEQRELACGVVLGVAFLTRYDAALLALLVGTALLVERRRPPWRLVSGFFGVATPWLLFSHLYFGSVVPATLGAKGGYVGAVDYLHRTLVYLKRTFEALVAAYGAPPALQDVLAWILPVLVPGGALVAALRDRRAALLAVYPVAHLLAYALIGADPGFVWHFYLVNPFMWVFLSVAVVQLVAMVTRGFGPPLAPPSEVEAVSRRRFLPRLAAGAVLFLVFVPLLAHVLQAGQRHYRPDPLAQDLERIGRWLDARYGPDTSVLHPAIGVLGWECDLHIIDQAGLVTPGLHYYDGRNHTPIGEVIRDHRPDLVLALEGHHPELADLGYSVAHVFDGNFRYVLWQRVASEEVAAP